MLRGGYYDGRCGLYFISFFISTLDHLSKELFLFRPPVLLNKSTAHIQPESIQRIFCYYSSSLRTFISFVTTNKTFNWLSMLQFAVGKRKKATVHKTNIPLANLSKNKQILRLFYSPFILFGGVFVKINAFKSIWCGQRGFPGFPFSLSASVWNFVFTVEFHTNSVLMSLIPLWEKETNTLTQSVP